MSSEIAFPLLREEELNEIATLATRRAMQPGENLFSTGERNYSFFAVLSGLVDILDESNGSPRSVTKHGPRSFTGDVDMLTGRPAVVTATCEQAGEVLEVPAAAIRSLLRNAPSVSEKLLEAFQTRRKMLEGTEFAGVRVIGTDSSGETLVLREFLYKNHVPHTFYEANDEEGRRLAEGLSLVEPHYPVLACSQGVVQQPALADVARCLGIAREVREEPYDVVIVGAGPAGLAAAVYAGSEGLETLVLDRVGPGGQASSSSRIENYMGFPAGLSGADLANRGYLQALKFGVEFTAPIGVQRIEPVGERFQLHLCTGQVANAKAVVVASGVAYRRLPAEGAQQFDRAGVHYAATAVESRTCIERTAIIVGGGNSAGQAAMYLAETAAKVLICIRGDNLRKNMSEYLVARIENHPKIELRRETEVAAMHGDDWLAEVTLHNKASDTRETLACSSLFVFIGAKPHTAWLPNSVALDPRGFIYTGPKLQECTKWPLDRAPCEVETSLPGVFAAGDVRHGSTKRCAFAVGDGALAITCVHQHLDRTQAEQPATSA